MRVVLVAALLVASAAGAHANRNTFACQMVGCTESYDASTRLNEASMAAKAVADAVDASGSHTNPFICQDDTPMSSWYDAPVTEIDWCTTIHQWTADSASPMPKNGIGSDEFYEASRELAEREVTATLDHVPSMSQCVLRTSNAFPDTFKTVQPTFTSSRVLRPFGFGGTQYSVTPRRQRRYSSAESKKFTLKSYRDVKFVGVAYHEPASLHAQGLVVAINVAYKEDVKVLPNNLLADLQANAKGYIGHNLREQLYDKTPKHGCHVSLLSVKKTERIPGTLGPSLTAWFSVALNGTFGDNDHIPLLTSRHLCRPFAQPGANERLFYIDTDLSVSSVSPEITTSDAFDGNWKYGESEDVSSDKIYSLVCDKTTFLSEAELFAQSLGNTPLQLDGERIGLPLSDFTKACRDKTDRPCVTLSNDFIGCTRAEHCEWTDFTTASSGATSPSCVDSSSGGSGGLDLEPESEGYSYECSPSYCNECDVSECPTNQGCEVVEIEDFGQQCYFASRRARSIDGGLRFNETGVGPRARRALLPATKTNAAGAANPGAQTTWIWTQAAFMPPMCTGMLAVAGTTDASFDNPAETTVCTKGCGGLTDPRNSHAFNELTWLLGVLIVLAAIFQISTTIMDGTSDEPVRIANLVVIVIAAHIIIGLWLMWDEGHSCAQHMVRESGHPQQVLTKLAWNWPHVFTTEAITWPYIVGAVLALGAAVLAIVPLVSEEALSGGEAFRAVAMIAPALSLVVMEIFVAVGTYGAMSPGRSEDPDKSMHFWVAEAFARMGGDPVDQNTSLAWGSWLVAVAFKAVCVGTVVIAARTYGLKGMTKDPAGDMPVTALLELVLLPGAVMVAIEAYNALKFVDDVWYGSDDSYMTTAAVLDFCASTSWIDTTVTEAGMVTLYVFALAFPVALFIALATLGYTRGDGPAAAAARMVALAASAGTVAITVYMFKWQKLGHCLVVPITPAFAYFAPFFVTVGVAVLAMTAVAIVAGGETMNMSFASGYAGYFGATKSTSFM